MSDVVIGLFGGAAASLAGSFVFIFDESTPFPVSILLARLLKSDPTDYYRLGLLCTFLYGLPAGAAYVYVFSRAPLLSITSLPGGLVYGTVWGLVLTAVFRLLIGDLPDESYGKRLLAAHLLYGLVLAGFVILGPTDPTSTAGPSGGF